MSTLKVDNIQSFSGGDVTLNGNLDVTGIISGDGSGLTGVGGDILPTNNTFTGNNIFTQDVNLSGGAFAPYDTSGGGVQPIKVFLSGSGGTLPNIEMGGFEFDNKAFASLNVNQATGFNIGVFEPNSNIRTSVGTNGNMNFITDGFRIEPTTTGSFNSIHMSSQGNFFSDYYGFLATENRLAGSPNNGNSQITVGAQNKASLTVNAFPTNGAYDELFEVTVDANGATFQDWLLPSYTPTPWFNVPQQGTPSFKRGLDVQGTNTAPGTTLGVDDGTGTPKLQVQNAALAALTGVDVVVNGTALIGVGLQLPGLGDYVDDAAAATGGVPLNGVYRTGNALKIRVV